MVAAAVPAVVRICRNTHSVLEVEHLLVITESAHWANLVIESDVRLYVRVSPPSEIYFQAFLPPLTKVLCQNFWIFGFPREKYRKKVVSDYAILAQKWS